MPIETNSEVIIVNDASLLVIDSRKPVVNINQSFGSGGSGESNTASNQGVGEGLFIGKSGVVLNFKSIVAGSNVTLTPTDNTLTISVSGNLSHVIENNGTPLTQRSNIDVRNGLTALDSSPDTVIKLGGSLLESTSLDGTNTHSFSFNNLTSFNVNSVDSIITGSSSVSLVSGTKLLRINSGVGGVELDLGDDSQGDMYFRNATGVVTRLPIINGKVLRALGNEPFWGDTITTVGLTVPSIFSVNGPLGGTGGTLNITLNTQNPNIVFAGPASGSAATPTFRSLVLNDIPDLSSLYLPYSGGTLTGYLTLHSDPINSSHAATKAYVDSLVSGLSWKNPARAATTGNITLANEQTIDGVSVVAGDRVLVKDQSTLSENGIYVVVNGGSWTRATDADEDIELISAALLITEGSTHAGSQWTQVTPDPEIGVSNIIFSQISSGNVYIAGAGLDLTGSTFSIGTNAVLDTMLRQSAGLSVVGRSSNTLGNVADITASSDNTVLRRSGTSIGFGLIQREAIELSTGIVLGRTTAGTGAAEALLVRNGLTLANGEINLGGSLLSDTSITGGGTLDIVFSNLAEFRASAAGSTSSLYSTTTGAGLSFSGGALVQATVDNGSITLGSYGLGINSTGLYLTYPSSATGDTFYRNVSGNIVARPIGTEGQIYTVVSGLPTWADPTGGGGGYTDEQAQDAVGTILVDSPTIDFTYSDATPSITGIVIDNSISNAKLRQSSGVSIIGRSANTLGNVADITAGVNNQVLMRSSDALTFSLLGASNFNTQSANAVLVGPIAGSAATPTFRTLVGADIPFPARIQTGTTYTIEQGDLGYELYFTDPSGCVVTLPSTLTNDFWFTSVRAIGAGIVSFVAGGSSNIRTLNGETTIEYEGGAVSWKFFDDLGNDEWYGSGALGLGAVSGGGSGTVTQVNLSNITGFATATGSPINGSGTLGYTLNAQNTNTFLAGPSNGGSAVPSFRLLSMLDIPRPKKEVSDTTYTVVDLDFGYDIYFTSPTGCTVTLNDSITIPEFWFNAIRHKSMLTGAVTFVAGGTATLNVPNGDLDISVANGAATFQYFGGVDDDWYGWGTLGSGVGGGGSAHIIENAGSALPQRANINFSNGIIASDNAPDTDVKLGGLLSENTIINAQNNSFTINSLSTGTLQASSGNGTITIGSGGVNLTTLGSIGLLMEPSTRVIMYYGAADKSLEMNATGTRLNLGSDAAGDVYYRGSDTYVKRLAAGSIHSLLGMSGTAGVPEYKVVSNGLTSAAGTLKLGGNLTNNTQIGGANTYSLTLGVDFLGSNRLDAFNVNVIDGIYQTIENSSTSLAGYQNLNYLGYEIALGYPTETMSYILNDGGQQKSLSFSSGAAVYTHDIGSTSSSQLFTGAQVQQVIGCVDGDNQPRIIINNSTTPGVSKIWLLNEPSTTEISEIRLRDDSIYIRVNGATTESILTQTENDFTFSKKIKPTSSSTSAGLNLGANLSTPATAENGDIFYDSGSHQIRARINGTWVTLGASTTLDADLVAIANLNSLGFPVRTASDTWTQRSIASGTGISVANGNGVSGNPTVSLSHLGIQNLTSPGADRLMFWDQSGTSVQWLTLGTNLSITGTTLNATGGGGISGSGGGGQVAYWTGSSTLSSEAGFEYNSTTNLLTADAIQVGANSIAGDKSITVGSASTSAALKIYSKGTAPLYLMNDDIYLGDFSSSPGTRYIRAASSGNSGVTIIPFGSGGSGVSVQLGSTGSGGGFQFVFTDDAGSSTMQVGIPGVSAPFKLTTVQSSSTQTSGAAIHILGGQAYQPTGNGNGGNILIQSGQRRLAGSGTDGNITIDPLTGHVFILVPDSSAGLPSGAAYWNGNILTRVP